MMRSVLFLALVCLAGAASAQDAEIPAFSWLKPKVDVTELQAKIDDQARLIGNLREIIGGLEQDLDAAADREMALLEKLLRFEKNEPTPAAKITMESIDRCPACVASDANDRPRYERAGWVWETVKVFAAPGRMYPRYRVCIGDTCEVVEIRNLSELDGKIQALLDRRKR